MSDERTRSVTFGDPSLLAASAAGKAGLQILREIVSGKLSAPPFYAALGLELVEVQDGFARLRLEPGEHLFGLHNAVQAGAASALLEAAMSAAVTTVLDPVTGQTTAALAVHLTRAINTRGAAVLAEGWVVHRGSRLVTAEGRLTDEQGKLLAHGSATAALIER
jgi:uncharacterized protein (TIGR00369 family)